MTKQKRDIYPVEVAGVHRDLRMFEVAPGVRIALVNILGDTELVHAVAKELAELIKPFDAEILVTAEAKSIPLAYALSLETGLDWVVLRKSYKPYMGDALHAETLSITTGDPQTLYLDEKDLDLIQGRRVLLIDDVISTGSTLQGMRLVVKNAGADIVGQAAIFTEGERAKWGDVVALGHLPVFTSDGEDE